MYQSAHFEETRTDVMHQLMRAHPLAALVRLQDGVLAADHIPFLIDAPTPQAPYGVLRGHIARANPLARQGGEAALAIFQGPQAYITPAWYVEKQLSGKVVPTYNYAVVHAHGTLRTVDDAGWLHALLTDLTARHEAERAQPWALRDAPADYLERMLSAIVGIEIALTRLDGKWKVSQNRSQADRIQIADGLAAPDAAMAALVRPA